MVRRDESGLAYLAVLFLVAAIAISMAVVGQNEDMLIKREKEQDWLFVGKQYQRAIASYYNQSPNGLKALPNKVEDLLLDKRFIAPVRHLRKAYIDPLNPQQNWVLMTNSDNQMTGVYSASQATILSNKIITMYSAELESRAVSYVDIKFTFAPKETNQTQEAEQPDAVFEQFEQSEFSAKE